LTQSIELGVLDGMSLAGPVLLEGSAWVPAQLSRGWLATGSVRKFIDHISYLILKHFHHLLV
jgi:hypothetical protein